VAPAAQDRHDHARDSAHAARHGLRARWDRRRMPVTDRHRDAEAHFRALLAKAELPPPDRVSYEPEELVFFFEDRKLAVIVELGSPPDVDSDVARALGEAAA
jgi:hypothetical protein